MARLLLPIVSAGVGAATMFFFDPARGRRRRALARDKGIRAFADFRDVADAGTRDLGNRAASMLFRLRRGFRRYSPDDDVLIERVRAKLGRYVSHPHAVEVKAAVGRVVLSGSILRHEHARLLAALWSVPGVKGIEDRLVAYKTAEGVSQLQGGRPRPGERHELAQDNWAPGTRLAAAAAGVALVAYSLRGRDPFRLIAVAGGILLLRSTANKPLRQLAGLRGHRGIDLQKTITIRAPIDQVFAYLAQPENYPTMMRHVRSVRTAAAGRSHWVVDGPAGTRVEWDAVMTQSVPNEVIAWRTVEGSAVAHAGLIRFEECDGATRLHVRVTYNPPLGLLGHAIAAFFGVDPKNQLDEDFMRLKHWLEAEAEARVQVRPEGNAANSVLRPL
ncbi:MAG: SRPBCC family protein [Rhodospirillaceae bacterium]